MPAPTKGPRLGGSPAAERLVTFAKRGDLHSRRRVLTVVRDKDVVYTLFDEIAPRFANRPGGYTRIVKTGPRKGESAPMAIIELVEELVEAAPAKAAKSSARKAARADAVAALARDESTETTVRPAKKAAPAGFASSPAAPEPAASPADA